MKNSMFLSFGKVYLNHSFTQCHDVWEKRNRKGPLKTLLFY